MSFLLRAAAILCLFASNAVAESDRQAEDQTPTGKFLNATETRPILQATQNSWIAVREYDSRDLVYFTHLLSWRCALFEVHYSINKSPFFELELPECDPANPNAIPDDATIFLPFALGTVQTVDIKVLYDDLGTEEASFERADVVTP